MSGSSDPLNFLPAERFFANAAAFQGPTSITNVHSSSSVDASDPLRYAVGLEFDDGTVSLLQFVSPTVWRVRYDPTIKSLSGYTGENTRSIVMDTFASLVDSIKQDENTIWRTRFSTAADKSYYTLSTVTYTNQNDRTKDTNGTVSTKLYMYASPLRLQATRTLAPVPGLQSLPPDISSSSLAPLERVVWETISRPFRYQPQTLRLNNIVVHVVKPGPAQYLGFGEQGGKSLLKDTTVMNYYCYDNMEYGNVYNQGPLDDREPLYHSCPYFLQMNGNPGYANITSTFIDNYSQVCVDLGKTNAGRVSVGTRFGGFDAYIISANSVPELISKHSLLIGRPRLKPRFILGNHQGCYGWLSRSDVEYVAQQYRQHQIPIDGLHIDVDFQLKYRTFTYNPETFPNVAQMFSNFLSEGIKCCTNITPAISLSATGDEYPTLAQGLQNKYFVPDERYLDGTDGNPVDVRYAYYAGDLDSNGLPIPYDLDPNQYYSRPDFGDAYNFAENFNSGYPYHGGVSYGASLGTAAYYLDLNRQEVRDFWGKQYEELFDLGLSFVWQDMTTPAIATGYGDMKGFPSRLMMSTDPYDQKPGQLPPKKLAAELWALYSYNLHKATYHGLNKLKVRYNKRNFIVGRGSFSGMHRYAGLWTGDNSSTWDFWRISVAQVLAVGYTGVTIVGGDIGGFMANGSDHFCDPDLLIRWYSGSVLLPWHRNHYIKRSGEKWFQEPYQYTNYLNDHPEIAAQQGWLYSAVEPICRYYVQLRYSLMQLLYDTMFENQLTGIPLARSMLITDTLDMSLFNENEAAQFLDNQYLTGNDVLVCAVTESHVVNNGNWPVYLPQPNAWYSFNLRVDGSLGIPLAVAVEGGSTFTYNASISNDPGHLPYVTPMYIREGAIIPQIEVRQFVGDTSSVNPVTVHVYPGKDNTYNMYLDDGISRSSAPSGIPQERYYSDSMAKDEYRQVQISQASKPGSNGPSTRTITIQNVHDGYGAANVAKDIGTSYTVVAWGDPSESALTSASFTDKEGKAVGGCSFRYDSGLKAGVATAPVELGSGYLNIVLTA